MVGIELSRNQVDKKTFLIGQYRTELRTIHMDHLQRSFLHGTCAVSPQHFGPPDSFQFDWRLLVSSLIVCVAGAMSASVGVGGFVPLPSYCHFS